jgi:hypothetical protein
MQGGLRTPDPDGIDVKASRQPDLIGKVMADLSDHGGGTYEQGTYLTFAPKDGYAVAIGGITIPTDQAERASLTWAMRVVTKEFGGSLVGTWVTDDKVYIDAVEYFGADRRQAALTAARRRDQLAIYDFAAGEEIRL